MAQSIGTFHPENEHNRPILIAKYKLCPDLAGGYLDLPEQSDSTAAFDEVSCLAQASKPESCLSFRNEDFERSIKTYIQCQLSRTTVMPNPDESNLEQFQIVAELLQRQDDVLEKLDELERRIENQINEANESRDSADLHVDADADIQRQESNTKSAA